MSKVLFEVELYHSYSVIDGVCDFLTDLLNKDMNDFVAFSSIGLSKEALNNHIGMYSLTEFIDECSMQERQRLIYKMLLERLYPVVNGKKMLFLAELDCFRPGYITAQEAQEFTENLYSCIEHLLQQVQSFIQNNKVYVSSLDVLIRNDVRSLYRLKEITKIGIRDLTYKEQVEITEGVL